MEVDLSPKQFKKLYGGDGGSYYTCSSADQPMLASSDKGAAKLVLEPRGLALPSYSDSAKIGYVLCGSGRAGIVLPEAPCERVIAVKKGDAIALPFGVVTWWFNPGGAPLAVLFLGDTSKALRCGEFSDFHLTGSRGIFAGFTTDFVSRAWDLAEQDAKHLVESQTGFGIVKLGEGSDLPPASEEDRSGMAMNCEEAVPGVDVEKGGRVVVVSSRNLPLVGDCGFGGDLVKLDGGAMCSPGFSCDSAFQVTYVTRGSGRVQVVGASGERLLEAEVQAGSLFVVPRFSVVSKIAGGEGMEWFSIVTTPDPIFTHLAGGTSLWKVLSSPVLQAAFNISPETEKAFRSKRTADAIFFPPPPPG